MGRNIGPDLQPNSDRLSLRTFWNILPDLNMNMSVYFTRHGNASYGKDDMNPNNHDGSIFDDGFNDKNQVTFWEKPPFLTQPVLDTRLGGTIGVNWLLPSSFGIFKLSADYGIQYGWNKSNTNRLPNTNNRSPIKGNNGLDHFWSIGGMWSY
jgi:hypothetical protein